MRISTRAGSPVTKLIAIHSTYIVHLLPGWRLGRLPSAQAATERVRGGRNSQPLPTRSGCPTAPDRQRQEDQLSNDEPRDVTRHQSIDVRGRIVWTRSSKNVCKLSPSFTAQALPGVFSLRRVLGEQRRCLIGWEVDKRYQHQAGTFSHVANRRLTLEPSLCATVSGRSLNAIRITSSQRYVRWAPIRQVVHACQPESR